jgi:MFS family permease
LRKPFYGWTIVLVSFLIGFTESGVFQNILSIFMKPMVDEFGWTRASVTGAIAFGSVCGGILSLAVGPLLDRHGPRMVAFWGVFFLSLGLFAMTFVSRLWQLYLFFGVGRMVAVGVLSLATAVSVSNWFVRFRGRAMGITKIGERFGSALLPLLIQFVILELGWRLAWGTLGVTVFLISGIPALLFLRRRPEDMGLLPDGDMPVSNGHGENAGHPGQGKPNGAGGEPAEPVWTRGQAMHSRTFWMVTLLNSLIPFGQAGMNFHLYPFLTDQGLSEATAILVLSTFSAFGMAGSVLWGMMTERFRIQRLLAVNIAGNALIFLALYWIVQLRTFNAAVLTMIFLLAALQGIFHGGRNPMVPVLLANFFGRRSLGLITGLANPFYFTANAIGPIFAGLCYDLYGNYSIPFYFFAATFLITSMISLRLKPPLPPGQSEAA